MKQELYMLRLRVAKFEKRIKKLDGSKSKQLEILILNQKNTQKEVDELRLKIKKFKTKAAKHFGNNKLLQERDKQILKLQAEIKELKIRESINKAKLKVSTKNQAKRRSRKERLRNKLIQKSKDLKKLEPKNRKTVKKNIKKKGF